MVKVFSMVLYPKKLNIIVCVPAGTFIVYFPSKSVVPPFVVPFIRTFANGNGSLLDSLSVNIPVTVPVFWAIVSWLTTKKAINRICFIFRFKFLVQN